jgi:hypothetical protein
MGLHCYFLLFSVDIFKKLNYSFVLLIGGTYIIVRSKL